MPKFLKSPASLLVLLVGLAGVLLVLYAWRLPPFQSSVEMTENAYLRGYVTVISPQLSGYVADVSVKDYEQVKAGQVLVRIDDRIFQQKLAQAKATLEAQKASLANSFQQEASAKASVEASQAQSESAQAALRRAKSNVDRVSPLAQKGVVTTSDAEQITTAFEQAEAASAQARAAVEVARQNLAVIVGSRASLAAAVEGAEAAVQLAEIDMQNTAIVAPRDGRVGEVGVRLGQYVTAGTQLTAIVPSEVWIVANYKETQLNGMKVGQRVRFTVDALDHQALMGHIERFSPAAGSEFSVIKADNATGNFTKVAQRVAVRISIDPGQEAAARLVPGLSVVTYVDKDAPAE